MKGWSAFVDAVLRLVFSSATRRTWEPHRLGNYVDA